MVTVFRKVSLQPTDNPLDITQPDGITTKDMGTDDVSSLTTHAPGTLDIPPSVILSVHQACEDACVADLTDSADSSDDICMYSAAKGAYTEAFLQIVRTAVVAADHPRGTKADKALCLAVASCIREVDPTLSVSLGMLYSTKLSMIPQWNESIVVIGVRDHLTYVIDFDFRSKFVIARASPSYRMLVGAMPSIFVGTMQELRVQIYHTAAAAEACLQGQGMPLAPWRQASAVLSLYTTVANRSHAGFHRSQHLLDEVITQSSKARTRSVLNIRVRWSLPVEASKVPADVTDSALVGRAARVCSLTLTKLQCDQPSWWVAAMCASLARPSGGRDKDGETFEKVPMTTLYAEPRSSMSHALLAHAGRIP